MYINTSQGLCLDDLKTVGEVWDTTFNYHTNCSV